jgi:hypothetical protein
VYAAVSAVRQSSSCLGSGDSDADAEPNDFRLLSCGCGDLGDGLADIGGVVGGVPPMDSGDDMEKWRGRRLAVHSVSQSRSASQRTRYFTL